jgi:hypothetical protein
MNFFDALFKIKTKLFEIKSEKNRSRGGEFQRIPAGKDEFLAFEAK